YLELHRAALAGERPVDWTALRYAYLESDELDIGGLRTIELHKQMMKASKANDYQAALEFSRRILEIQFFDIEAQAVCAFAAQKIGDAVTANECAANVADIRKSIMTSDATSVETAPVIVTVREGMGVLNVVGYVSTETQLIEHDSKTYAYRRTIDRHGQVREFYFSTDLMWEAHERKKAR
ncbi:MAG: DUF4919 domain-containing protein, partial [Parvibaculum sp.]|nr:DUF4919 domain-containing protein [Parvibaculum sp.]